MTDTWLIVEAGFPTLQSPDIMQKFVKPVIDHFDTSLTTFHFFFEPHLLLRLKADEQLVTEKLRPTLKRRLSDMNATIRSIGIDAQYTEEPDYGDGWKLAQKFFEYGSRSAIARGDTGLTLGAQFNEFKFVHLLLNQWGYSIDKEALFHFKKVAERLAMHFSNGNLNLVKKKLSQIMTELEPTLEQISVVVKRKLAES